MGTFPLCRNVHVDGNTSIVPHTGEIVKFNSGNSVSPPKSTSLRYTKNTKKMLKFTKRFYQKNLDGKKYELNDIELVEVISWITLMLGIIYLQGVFWYSLYILMM